MSLVQHSRDFFRHQIVVTARRANEAHDLRFIPWPVHNDNQLPPAELTAPAGSCPAGTIKHTPAQVPAGFLHDLRRQHSEREGLHASVSSPFHAALNNREGQRDHGL